jgi:dihydrofolate reductase
MRQLVLEIATISLDGFICEEDTDFWRLYGPMTVIDDELDEYFLATLGRAGTHIMGRVTYEAMARHWPTSIEPVAAIMNDTPKVVFSQTLVSADWPESRIASGGTAEEVAKLKREPGGEIVAHGGAKFAQSLARLGLVDVYRLYVYPVVLGSGVRLFTDLPKPRPLWRTVSRSFKSGILALEYQPAQSATLRSAEWPARPAVLRSSNPDPSSRQRWSAE